MVIQVGSLLLASTFRHGSCCPVRLNSTITLFTSHFHGPMARTALPFHMVNPQNPHMLVSEDRFSWYREHLDDHVKLHCRKRAAIQWWSRHGSMGILSYRDGDRYIMRQWRLLPSTITMLMVVARRPLPAMQRQFCPLGAHLGTALAPGNFHNAWKISLFASLDA